jgi:hypothetical protein
MSWSNGERLYNLLPAIYRVRDAAQGEPLRALLSVIESELETLEADIEGLYENWFIETCDEWVIPYIGDLLGVRMLHAAESAGAYSLRAYVANTLRYRRRKGTATILEQLARDVTNWPTRAVEFFQLLATTQHINHIRLHNARTPDLRDTNQLELLDTPFETAARTGEVRRIAGGRGKYNIPNVGLFMWRLQSYAVTRSTARAVIEPSDGRYTFNPLGLDAALFNRPQTETEITHLAEEINVPGILRCRALYDDLEAYRDALVSGGETPRAQYFGTQPVLEIFVDGADHPLLPEELVICNLSGWDAPGWTPLASEAFTRADGTPFQTQVAVDPELGRLAFLDRIALPVQVEVSYAYGFSGDVGGGPYNRQESVKQALTREVTWQMGVSQVLSPVQGEIVNSLSKAIDAWNAQPAGTVGVIAIMDSHTYREDLTGGQAIIIPAGSQLILVAADWPAEEILGSLGLTERNPGRLEPTGLRPHLRGNISVRGTAPGEGAEAGELILGGLLIEGALRVLIGNLGSLQVNHCTLAPGLGDLAVNPSASPGSQNDRLRVSMARSIADAISLPETVPGLHIEDSIVDRPGDIAVSAPGAAVTIDNSTILGRAETGTLEASESIFSEPVVVERRQIGCVRFSYVPGGSRTPRRYRCQPDLALKDVTDAAEKASIRTRLTPLFTFDDYGNPAYAQLSLTCAEEIRTGAKDGSEMGVFNHLKQPQRAANLRAALDEYLPFGLEAGIIYVT